MKESMMRIVPRGATQQCVSECAEAGEASVAVNVRECNDALQVVGSPQSFGSIPAGDVLLLLDGERAITMHGQQVMCDGHVLATLDGALVGAHRVGQLVVIVTSEGLVWLRRSGDSYVSVRMADAFPDITLSALESTTLSAGMDALSFGSPYTSWPAALTTSDVGQLTTRLHRAWSQLQQEMDMAGAYGGMMQVRVGVRLMDDTYLGLSDPVTLGSATLADATPVNVECTLDGTAVSGIPASTLTRHRYRVGITVNGGIADDWVPMVRAIDILATTCQSPVVAEGSAQYRCIAIGGSVRRPRLEFGLSAVSEGAINSQLAQSGWHIIASTSDVASLSEHRWVSDAVAVSGEVVTPGVTSYVVTRSVENADRMSAEEANKVEENVMSMQPIASTTCNGRLYCIDSEGMLAVSRPGNALVSERQRIVTGAAVRAIMPLGRPVYSNGFGRYPVVLFTDDGIYALPQTTAGSNYGEPRLLDRTVIGNDCLPTEGGRDVYFVSHRGHLCRVRGGVVEVVWRNTDVCQLAWDDVHNELWVLMRSGSVMAVMPSGRTSVRTVTCQQLYGDTTHALAVTAGGLMLDLTDEVAVNLQPVEWQSHAIAVNGMGEVVWQVLGDGTLSLEVTGERGISCHGFLVGRLRVSGQVNAPLRQRLMAQPLRTMRLHISGHAASGLVMLATTVPVPVPLTPSPQPPKGGVRS